MALMWAVSEQVGPDPLDPAPAVPEPAFLQWPLLVWISRCKIGLAKLWVVPGVGDL